jgi:hypothetical protein
MAGLNWEEVNDVMLPVVLYGSATWFVMLRMFENGVLRVCERESNRRVEKITK